MALSKETNDSLAPFGKNLIGIIVSNALVLIAYLILRAVMVNANEFFDSNDLDEIIPIIQWLRFSTLVFVFFDLTTLIFDKIGTRQAKLFTLLTIVVFAIISWFFLFPAIPGTDLLYYFY